MSLRAFTVFYDDHHAQSIQHILRILLEDYHAAVRVLPDDYVHRSQNTIECSFCDIMIKELIEAMESVGRHRPELVVRNEDS